MTDEQFQRLLQILGDLGSSAYQAALRQVYVDAHIALIWGILFSVLFVIGISSLLWGIHGVKMSEHRENYWAQSGSADSLQVFLVMGGGFLSLVSLILACIDFTNFYTYLASPQWQAIQYLAHLVH